MIDQKIKFSAGDGLQDDTDAIQRLLDQGSARVYLPAPQVKYIISRTLKIHSRQELVLDRFALIQLTPGSNCLMLENADPENGNENIAITGGIWDMNNMEQAPNPLHYPYSDHPRDDAPWGSRYLNNYFGTAIRFFHVKNLYIKALTMRNPVTFAIQMAKIDQFTVDDLTFDFNDGNPFPGNMDGVHLDGGCRNGRITNLKGACYDDLVALNADDCYHGPIEDIAIDGIFSQDCHSAVRMLSAKSWIRRISIANVYGTFYQYAVAFSKYYPELGHRGLFDQISLRNLYVSKAERYTKYRKDGSFVFPLIWLERDVQVQMMTIAELHRREEVTPVEAIGLDPGAEVQVMVVQNCSQSNLTGQPAPFLKNQGTIHRLYLDRLAITNDAVVNNTGQIDEICASPDVKPLLRNSGSRLHF